LVGLTCSPITVIGAGTSAWYVIPSYPRVSAHQDILQLCQRCLVCIIIPTSFFGLLTFPQLPR
jgi:hypothetical protein